ncbi:MAG: RluA family pseudouridine synthase [Defluviitaleaceae bacterium]|nr:RluA family pseudouridine synthase [Defluviitaleaceae bacterium]
MQKTTITANEANQRLDKFIHRRLGRPPKSFVQKMLRKKNITVNGRKADGAFMLAEGDVVKLFISEKTAEKFAAPAKTFPKGDVVVVYEDNYVSLLNKPAGLSVQPDIAGGDSLIGRLRGHYNSDFAPVAINRLDKNTTGLVICAKILPAAQALSKLMHDRKIQKIYLGVAQGEIAMRMTLQGTHTKDRERNIAKIAHDGDGKAAHTHIVPLKYCATKDLTLLEIHLHTGRSHQIRAHLQSIGHPLLGDIKYGGKKAGRQLLHAHQLIFPKLDGVLANLSNKTFTAPPPLDFLIYTKTSSKQ